VADLSFQIRIGDDPPRTIGIANGFGRVTLELIVNLWTIGRVAESRFETEALRAVDGRHEVVRWKLRAPKPGEQVHVEVGTVTPDEPSSIGEIVPFDELDTERSDAWGLVWNEHEWPTATRERGAGWCLEATPAAGRTLCLEATREGELLSVDLIAVVPRVGAPTVMVRAHTRCGWADLNSWQFLVPDAASAVLELTVHAART
jgi:hypothetical protein